MAVKNYDIYLSPFSWRYGSDEMRSIWSEVNKRRIWRQIWTALAEVQAEFGLVTAEQAADLRAHVNDIDVPRALEIEAEIRHDVMAEVRAFAEQCPLGGGIIHMGLTSMDVVDNTDVLRVRQSLGLLLDKLKTLLLAISEQVERWAHTPIMAFTHLQPAEPSTLGYRLAQYAQDFLIDWEQ
jgi:adenylosuccinate lyase